MKIITRVRCLILMLAIIFLVAAYYYLHFLSEKVFINRVTRLEPHEVIVGGTFDLVKKAFLEIKLDPNKFNENKRTPLFAAIDRGNPDIVELLLQSGADVEIKNRDGVNALEYAIEVNASNTIIIMLREQVEDNK